MRLWNWAEATKPLGVDQEFEGSEAYFKIELLRANVVSSDTAKSKWQAVRDACNAALALYPNAWLLAWRWLEASGKLEGFQGLASGVDLLANVCGRWEFAELDYERLSNKLRELILSVPLTGEGEYTYTTVLNAHFDPERAAMAANAVRDSDSTETKIEELDALNAALNRLYVAMDKLGASSYGELIRLLARIKAYLAMPTEPKIPTASEVQAEAGSANEAGEARDQARAPEETTQVFLQIEGFTGGSASIHHWGWIEVESYRQNMEKTSPSIVVKKRLDVVSPKLYLACCTGRVFPRVTFDLCRGPGGSRCVLRVELSDAAISSITQETGCDVAVPAEEITFRYQSVAWTYTQFGADQIAEGVVATSSRVLAE